MRRFETTQLTDARSGPPGRQHQVVAVFGSGRPPAGEQVLAEAERLGRSLAGAGLAVMPGGYGGTMEAASRGARQATGRNARFIGVTMDLFKPPLQPNAWLTEELRVRDFFCAASDPKQRRRIRRASRGHRHADGGFSGLVATSDGTDLIQTVHLRW